MSTPQWIRDLERAVMEPARLRTIAARQVLFEAEREEARVFKNFEAYLQRRLATEDCDAVETADAALYDDHKRNT